jgi:SAM-dependent methyltransferase
MNFDAAAESYDAFMGRYSSRLSPLFADFAGVAAGQRVLDVGCGPGALTAELVRRLGPAGVSAADPMAHFVAAARQRNPGVDVVQASAERLPFGDGTFDRTLAQLVVHFMTDPVAGIAETARVTRPTGIVAACVWDHAGDHSPLSPLWRVARTMDPAVDDEGNLPGAREGDLARLFRNAGLAKVEAAALIASVEHSTFDEWWEPYTRGVGPAGRYVAGLTPERREELRRRCREELSDGPFVLTFQAWAARGQPAG